MGSQLGNYRIVGWVADGATGRVYDGIDTSGQRVAVKVLHNHTARDPVAVERFKREFETANEFSHPHIVNVLELGQTPDGSWFMAMEYLEGEELGELLRREGSVAEARALRILAQVALALDYAHSFGVIHRDLKPDNIFLCRSEQGDDVRILDFGSVKLQMEMGPKLTAYGTTLGSPYYMSPEQAMGKQDVDQRTDVFAVTAILFEMLTGQVAFEGGSVAEILMKIVNEATPRATAAKPSLPAGLDAVIDRGTAKDKAVRYATTVEMADAALGAFGLAWSAQQCAQTPQGALEGSLGRPSMRAPVRAPAHPSHPTSGYGIGGVPFSDPGPQVPRATDLSSVGGSDGSNHRLFWIVVSVLGGLGVLALIAVLVAAWIMLR